MAPPVTFNQPPHLMLGTSHGSFALITSAMTISRSTLPPHLQKNDGEDMHSSNESQLLLGSQSNQHFPARVTSVDLQIRRSFPPVWIVADEIMGEEVVSVKRSAI